MTRLSFCENLINNKVDVIENRLKSLENSL